MPTLSFTPPVLHGSPVQQPPAIPFERFSDADAALERIIEIYERNTAYLREAFKLACAREALENGRARAFYPAIRISVQTYDSVDSRLSYGYVSEPGVYQTSVTRPALFRHYLREQISLLLENHGVPIEIGESRLPIPLHFAFTEDETVSDAGPEALARPLRDMFDVPDLMVTDDAIVNGTWSGNGSEPRPLAPFTATRVDYSLHRLRHYTATSPQYFQNFVIFTNYQVYVDEFCAWAKSVLAQGGDQYDGFVEPGNVMTDPMGLHPVGAAPTRLPQMPAYHLLAPNHQGITLVNIGVGPSNAKTITDHIAVLRPHAWLMVGHCAGLRGNQNLGDYVLAHGYVREDHVLDADLPTWVPIPPLAEVQVALEQAVEEVSGLSGWDLKRIMRTGTVASIDNRNWELRDHQEIMERFSQSRAIALDMESATVAANGFRFRVPYGTLLCVSDKPLHGELKLPGMASAFYRSQVSKHLEIGLRTLERLRRMPPERLQSRKLRSFLETAFQ